MKNMLFLFALLFYTSILAQTNNLEEVDIQFTGRYDLEKNVITKKLAKKAWVGLGKPSKEGREFIANECEGYIVVGLVKNGTNRASEKVIFKNGKIVELSWSKENLEDEEIEKCRQTAISNGLGENDMDFGLFKFDKEGLIWYELSCTIDNGYYFFTIDHNYNLVLKEEFSQ